MLPLIPTAAKPTVVLLPLPVGFFFGFCVPFLSSWLSSRTFALFDGLPKFPLLLN
jgi:hypothetical protein